MSIFNFLGSVISPITKMVDDLVTSDEEKIQAKTALNAVHNQLSAKFIDLESKLLTAKTSIIIAETKSKSWLVSNWRPMLMCIFMAVIINNYIIAPYVAALFGASVMLEIPPDMWALLKLGVSGYIAGRSIEKGIEKWRDK